MTTHFVINKAQTHPSIHNIKTVTEDFKANLAIKLGERFVDLHVSDANLTGETGEVIVIAPRDTPEECAKHDYLTKTALEVWKATVSFK